MVAESTTENETPVVKSEETKPAAKKIKNAKAAPAPAAKKVAKKVAVKKIKAAKPAPVKKEVAATEPKAVESNVPAKKVKKAKEAPAKSAKKLLRNAIEANLEKAFPNIKKAVGEKKFHKHVKKASKVLVKGAAKKDKG